MLDCGISGGSGLDLDRYSFGLPDSQQFSFHNLLFAHFPVGQRHVQLEVPHEILCGDSPAFL